LIGAITSPRIYDPTANGGNNKSLLDFSSASISSLEAKRQSATQTNEYNGILASRASDAISNATGVNIDTEMQSLLDLEHSYSASARIISTIDSMLKELLQAAS